MRTRFLAVAVVVAVFAATGRSDDMAPPRPRLVTKVFSVADLVTPIPNVALTDPPTTLSGVPAKQPTVAEMATNLMTLVRDHVQPNTWEATTPAGVGRIEFFEIGAALVVTQTEEALKEIEALLDAVRRLQDKQIVFEVRVVTASVDALQKCDVKCPVDADSVTFWKDCQLVAFMEGVQGDRLVNVLQSPKLTLFNGQKGTVAIKEQQHFVTEVTATRVNGQVALVPKSTPVDVGMSLTLSGTISADTKSVRAGIDVTGTFVDGDVEMIPLTTTITPMFEGGSQGVPVPFTQFLQAPNFVKLAIHKQLVIPSGGHAVIAGPTRECTSTVQDSVPVLSEIPFIGEWFIFDRKVTKTVRTLLIVSPRTITSDEPPAAVNPPVSREAPVCAPVFDPMQRAGSMLVTPPVLRPMPSVQDPMQRAYSIMLASPAPSSQDPMQRARSIMVAPPTIWTDGAGLTCRTTAPGQLFVLPCPAGACPTTFAELPGVPYPCPGDIVIRVDATRTGQLMVSGGPSMPCPLALPRPVPCPHEDIVVRVNETRTDLFAMSAGTPSTPVAPTVVLQPAPSQPNMPPTACAPPTGCAPPAVCAGPSGVGQMMLTCQLRNAAAADVQHALKQYLGANSENIALAAEPATNTLMIVAPAAKCHQLLDLIAKIDEAPEQVMIQAMIVHVPAEFVKAAGLDDKGSGASVSVLTERETRMLRGLIGREPKAEVLSRPTLMVNDNQTGFAQVGQNYPYVSQGASPAGGKEQPTVQHHQLGVTMRITPRVQPDKKAVLLRGEFEECCVADTTVDLGNGVKQPAFNSESFQTSTIVPFGGSLVAINGPVGKGSEGKLVTLTLLTVAPRGPGAKPLCHDQGLPTPTPTPMLVPASR